MAQLLHTLFVLSLALSGCHAKAHKACKRTKVKSTTITQQASNTCAESPFHAASRFNAWFSQDFSSFPADVQGSLAAGGNIDFIPRHQYGYSVADQLPPFQCTAGAEHMDEVTLLAGGHIHWPMGRHYYGHMLTGLPATSSVSDVVRSGLAQDCEVLHGQAVNQEAVHAYLESLSDTIATQPDTGSYTRDGKTIHVHAGSPNMNNQAIVSIPGDVVSEANGFFFNDSSIDADTTILFNVDGQDVQFDNFAMDVLVAFRERTLWNFYEAERLTIQYISVEGSVLAPKADYLDTMGMLNGQAVGKSHAGALQFNHFPFQGCLPCADGFDCDDLATLTITHNTAAAVNEASVDAEADTKRLSGTVNQYVRSEALKNGGNPSGPLAMTHLVLLGASIVLFTL